ncbi:LAFE_0G14136g1_1 [Lachancea fermentati]|uniref:LAFE_0G14136g1_1 n=1 Tax=Lachancea fermentati TaxID=4955 RepID=A0A1G4MI92_LACFM|nr:LAFE_0G14136g1_1 [Lachancea fermentati]
MNPSADSTSSNSSLPKPVKNSSNTTSDESIPPVRTLPKQGKQIEAHPNADNQDKLWTEIDVLDDVRRMSKEDDLYEGFPPAFEKQLKQLRIAHVTLLQTMKRRRNKQKDIQEALDSNEDERKLVDDVMHCLNGLRD